MSAKFILKISLGLVQPNYVKNECTLVCHIAFEIFKGQLNSEWIYEVIVSPKMQTKNYKDFYPTKQGS